MAAHFQSTATPCRELKRRSEEFYSQLTPTKKKKHSDHLNTTPTKCDLTFFDCPCEELAHKLLGCVLMRVPEGGDEKCWGVIVETEAYLGGEDRAAHSHGGKRTERNEAMYMPPGTAYVYSIYGMHSCFNISSRGAGAAVLIRALRPLGGLESMRERRKRVKKDRDLCNGPAKLCQAMTINKTCNKLDLCSSKSLWVEFPGEVEDIEGSVVASGRIGVDYAGEEWSSKLLRFYFRDCQFVSKK